MILISWLTIVLLAMSLLTGVAAWIYLRLTNVKHKGQSEKKDTQDSSKKKNLKNFFNIKDIQKGVVILNGDRYRLILRVTAQDFYLLSEIEQNNAEDMMASVLRGLEFPVQILMTSEALDTRKAVQALKTSAAELPETIKEHALERVIYLENLQQQRAVTARRAYLVIPFDTVKGLDYARAELYARAGSLMDALSRAKMTAEPLDTGGVCDLLSHLLNRGRTWRPSEAGEKGIMSLFTISEKESA